MHSPFPLFDTDGLRTLEARGIALHDGDGLALMRKRHGAAC